MTEAFEKLVSLLDYPMFVVTTRAGDESAGCLVGFATQVSIRPPRFIVGLSNAITPTEWPRVRATLRST
jgi:flavin reductase (DIM6/NTAB) family NADH-FMN oxidoreductase RutF